MSHRERYREYREAGQQLNNKILQTYSDRELILNSAEALGIDHDGTNVAYEFESDMTVHFEFLLYEYRRDGQTAAEQYFEERRWDTDMELTILEARLEAETALFEIERRVDHTDTNSKSLQRFVECYDLYRDYGIRIQYS
jgi:hypothetical protein